jgi:hypothetical protein
VTADSSLSTTTQIIRSVLLHFVKIYLKIQEKDTYLPTHSLTH